MAAPDAQGFDIETVLTARSEVSVVSLWHRFSFPPGADHEPGRPLDFAWIPNLCSRRNDIAGEHTFRSPCLIARQGHAQVALVPHLQPSLFAGPLRHALSFRLTVGVGMAILFDSVMSFWGSTSNDAAFNAWITDITTERNRGAVVGVTEILKWIALLVTYAGAGFLVAALGYTGFFVAIGALVIVLGAVGGLIAREPAGIAPPSEGFWKRIADTFQWKSLKENRTLLAILVAVAVWNIAFNVFFPYLMIYLQHYVRLPVVQSSVLIAVAILVGGIAAGYPLGILADRWGRRPMAFAAIALEAAGLLLFSFTKSFAALLASGILWVMPMAAWSIATTAWEKDLFPEEKRGQFQGWEILFRVTIAMTLGPLLGGWLASRYGIPTVLDGKPGFIPTPLLFQVAAGGTLLATLPLLATRGKKQEANTAN
jgi:uncharacterized membrane protein (DUF485 family)